MHLRYVGKTNNVARREKQHIAAAKNGNKTPLYEWVRSIGCDPQLNLKTRKISSAEYLVTPQLRYTKLERLKNDAMNPFTDMKLSKAVQFVILQHIEDLINLDGSLKDVALDSVLDRLQTNISLSVCRTKKGKDSGFGEPNIDCP